jgi:hypothetical protein
MTTTIIMMMMRIRAMIPPIIQARRLDLLCSLAK